MENNISAHAAEALQYVQQQLPAELKGPKVGIVCGSGLGGLADTVLPAPRHEVSYATIPYFPRSTVHGHAGKLLFGILGKHERPVVLLVGRVHYYEGHSMQDITFYVRLLKLLGVDTLIVTNAAGGLNPEYTVGDIVVLNDHINLAGLAGTHPLRGPNIDDFGVRFPPLSDAYDLSLRREAHRTWQSFDRSSPGRKLHEGIYAYVGGPSYETRAECRMLRMLGADVVGMSTVPEIIVARHCGVRVLALSLVTNNAVLEVGPRGDSVEIEDVSQSDLTKTIAEGKASHEEVLASGREAAADFQILVHGVLRKILTPDSDAWSTGGQHSVRR